MNKIEKAAILSISILTIIATAAIAPALGGISKEFSHANPLLVKIIITLPALVCIFVSPFTDAIAKKFGKKNTLVVATILYLIGGVLGYFSTGIYFLLVTRLILGLGLGITAPMSLAIMGDFFEGKEKANFMGYSSAVSNISAVIATLIVGYLANISWRAVFLIYLCTFITLILIIVALPKKAIYEVVTINEKDNSKIGKEVYAYSIIILLGFIIYYTIPTNLSLFLEQKNIGSSEVSGILIAILTLCSFITGMVFGKFVNVFKEYVGFFSFILMVVLNSIVLITIGIILVGLGFGLTFPYGMYFASKAVSLKHVTLAISIVTTALYIGEFLSPIILDFIAKVIHQNNIIGSFYASILLCILALIISFIIAVKDKKNSVK